jgi:hypothetical protein
MRNAAMVGWLAMAATVGCGKDKVTVYIANGQVVPVVMMARAQNFATGIFGHIDVSVLFKNGKEPVGVPGAISVQFDTGAPSTFHPDALAYALPYGASGTRIHVFFDRVAGSGDATLAGTLLGHVMAHELGHVLEGFSQHSESGVMKARWDDADFLKMKMRRMKFDAADVDLIHRGMAARMGPAAIAGR